MFIRQSQYIFITCDTLLRYVVHNQQCESTHRQPQLCSYCFIDGYIFRLLWRVITTQFKNTERQIKK
jgi:hypothetical protein